MTFNDKLEEMASDWAKHGFPEEGGVVVIKALFEATHLSHGRHHLVSKNEDCLVHLAGLNLARGYPRVHVHLLPSS